MQQLATLDQLKRWIPNLVGSDTEDPLLNDLLVRVSGTIMGCLSRSDVAVRTVTETINGRGTSTLVLREWPVLSISSLSVDGRDVSAAANFNDLGYRLSPWDNSLPGSPQPLTMRGRMFSRGIANVALTYRAGYLQTDSLIVAGGLVTATQNNGSWVSDQGVTYANGTPLVLVANNPAQGQYSVDPATGKYTLNAADDGATLLVSYGFVPAPLAQACVEICGEAYRRRTRIGQSSKSMDGKVTEAYDITRGVNEYVKKTLQMYRRVTL